MKKERTPHSSGGAIDEDAAQNKIREEQTPAQADSGTGVRSRPEPMTADEIVRSAQNALQMEAADEPSVPRSAKHAEKAKKHSFFHRKREVDSVPEDDIYYGLQLKSLQEYQHDYEETIRFDAGRIRQMEEEIHRTQEGSASKSEQEAVSAQAKPVKPEKTVSAQAKPTKLEETVVAQAEPVKPEKAVSAQAKPVEPEETVFAQAKPVKTEKAVSSDSRQGHLEQILRSVGLDTEGLFDSSEIPKPEPPVNPPRPAGSPEIQPPIPPIEEPEPVEPQRIYPIEEPSHTSVPKNIEKPAAALHTEVYKIPAQKPDSEPGAVKEPTAPPRTEQDSPVSPTRKEPAKRDYPRYRAAALPLQIIELNTFEDTLAAEAAKYELPPIHAPEPIPFPLAAAEPEKEPAEKCKSDTEPEEDSKLSSPAANASKDTPILQIPLAPQQSEGEELSEEKEAPEASEEPKKAGKGKKKHFRFVGTVEDQDTPEPKEEPQEELVDYTSPEDAPSVRNALLAGVRKLYLRFAVTGIFTLILAAYSVAWEYASALPAELHTLFTPQKCLVVSLIFLALTVLFCIPAIWNGLQGLFRFQANSDSTAAVAALAALMENIVFLCTGFPASCRLYSSLAVLALFLNTAAKLSMEKRILRNFRFLTSSEQKYSVQMFDDYNTALRMAKNCVAGEPKIAYQVKTGFLQNFLKHSFSSDDPIEHISQVLAPAGFIGSLVLCIATAVLTKDARTALTVFTASACVCVPFGGLLSVNLPLAQLSKISERCGGMTVGWDAVEQFSQTNAVLVDAEDLFPRGTVVLNGIQTFAGQRIDQAILDATALTAAVGGPLNGLFSQIVKTRGEVLPHVERTAYEDGMGISGTVSDRLILVGNGALLKHHGVDAPSHDYEEKYLRAGKIPVYLACGGMLVAMFLVYYRSDRRRAVELRRLEYNGISLLVRTHDPNITPELVASCFSLSPHSISILPEKLGNVSADLHAHPPERAPAVLATKGRTGAMMRMITACTRQKGNITVGAALQAAGAVLGFALVGLFTFCRGISQLSTAALLLFEGFWTAAAIFVPHIRRP